MRNVQLVQNIEVVNDIDILISTAVSRKSKEWVNQTLKWSDFLDRISRVKRTAETLRQYKEMKKDEQNELKDVGGFVGGHLIQGKRKVDMVENRSILTLDADYANPHFWEDVQLLFPYASAIYSTRSHSKEKPRYRLIIPMSRTVSPEEYVAIARKVADDIGIDLFDDTTYEPHRLMYWGSVSSDGEFSFDYQDLEILNPDDILNKYLDWTDPSEWALSSRQDSIQKRLADKQGDPLTKPGIIGMFNRSYTIPEAIETFLPDVYELAGDGRYTYKHGSTSGGLILYQDEVFAYSHHGTDPISGKLVNAFDLVRLHLFGAQDEDAKEDTPVNRLPSSVAMSKLASGDIKVKSSEIEVRMARAASDFSDVESSGFIANPNINTPKEGSEEEENASGWMEDLSMNSRGKIESTRRNIILILNNDVNLKGKLQVNDFSQRSNVSGDLPWRTVDDFGDRFLDFDESGLRNYLETVYDISDMSKTTDALIQVTHQNKFHPVRDYLNSLQWDGVPRAETMLHTFLGAEDTELNRTVTRKTLVAAVARVMKPGIKFDYMLTLEGPQGLGKSSIFHRLAGEWFSDSLTSIGDKESFEQLQGSWIIEMSELSAVRKSSIESTKHFITKQVDEFRVAYGKHTAAFPRQCIFIGTTNNKEFLKDSTGNRRYWVVPVGVVPFERKWSSMTDEEVDQIWAEAVHYYNEGEKIYLDPVLEEAMSEVHNGYTLANPLQGVIEEHLEKKVPEGFHKWSVEEKREFFNSEKFDMLNAADAALLGENSGGGSGIHNLKEREYICALEIWIEVMGKGVDSFNRTNQKDINKVLSSLEGWEPVKVARNRIRFGEGIGLQRAYQRVK